MLKWLKSLFGRGQQKIEQQQPEQRKSVEAVSNSVLMQPLQYQKPDLKCKLHWDYIPMRPPTNNCNTCWEVYSQNRKR